MIIIYHYLTVLSDKILSILYILINIRFIISLHLLCCMDQEVCFATLNNFSCIVIVKLRGENIPLDPMYIFLVFRKAWY